jgi:DNA repair protein RadC
VKLPKLIRNPAEAAAFLRKAIPRRMFDLHECAVVAALDIEFKAIGEPIIVALGTADSVRLHIKDVFREAISRDAIGVIVAHNHPNGNCAPSTPDIEAADRFEAAGEILGIAVLDNIVLTRDGYSSRSEGHWDKRLDKGQHDEDLARAIREILALTIG